MNEGEENIVNLDEHRPHINIYTNDGKVHVVPECLIQDWISGVKEPDAECTKRIIEEWFHALKIRGALDGI